MSLWSTWLNAASISTEPLTYTIPVTCFALLPQPDIMHPNYPRPLLVQIHSVSKEEQT